MRRFVLLFVLLPLAVAIVVLSVANRHDVTLSLDPFGVAPNLAVAAPLFVFLFGALALGIVIGGLATWIRQGRWRRQARTEKVEIARMREETDRLRERNAALVPALPPSRGAG